MRLEIAYLSIKSLRVCYWSLYETKIACACIYAFRYSGIIGTQRMLVL